MAILSNGCYTTNGGHLVNQNQFKHLSLQLEVLSPETSGHEELIVVTYLPYHEGKCKKISYATSGDQHVHVEFFDSLDSLHPYRRTRYHLYNLPPKHVDAGIDITKAYQVTLKWQRDRESLKEIQRKIRKSKPN